MRIAIRTPILSSLSLLFLLIGGCSAFDFDIQQAIPEQRVPGSLVSMLLPGFLPNPIPLTIDLQSETKARGTGPVKAAYLTMLSFSVTQTAMAPPSQNNFDFVQSVSISIESTKQGTTLSAQKIAGLSPVPRAATQISLQTDSTVDLLPYINEGSRLTSTATGNAPPHDITFDGQFVIHVHTL